MTRLLCTARTSAASTAPWLEEAVLPELYRRLRDMDGRHLSMALYSLAQVRYVPVQEKWTREFWHVLRSRLPALSRGEGPWPVTAAAAAEAARTSGSAAGCMFDDDSFELDHDEPDDQLDRAASGTAREGSAQAGSAMRQARGVQAAGDASGAGSGGSSSSSSLDGHSVSNLLFAAAELKLQPPMEVSRRLIRRAQELLPHLQAPVSRPDCQLWANPGQHCSDCSTHAGLSLETRARARTHTCTQMTTRMC